MGIFNKKRKEKRNIDNIKTISFSTPLMTTTKNTTVIACKNMIIDSISNLPIKLYFRKNNNERIVAYNHTLYSLFKRQPNTEEPISLFISRVVDSLIDNGNAYIYKQKDNQGRIVAIYFVDATKVVVTRNPQNIKIFNIDGVRYTEEEILHIPGKYYDGLVGKSLTALARDAITLSNRLGDYTNYHFENMISGGRLNIDISDYAEKNRITDSPDEIKNTIEEISKYLNTNYTGEENAGKPLITPPGVKAEQLESASNQNAQLAELRELQERQICQVFDIPYDLFTGENKYNSMEQRNELYKNRTLQFWTNRLETFYNFLLTPYERERYYFEFDYNNFLKTDKRSRTENQVKQLQNGILTINDILAMENLPSIDTEIGDTRFVPNTYIPLTEENIGAYFASQKLKLQELDDTHVKGVGDDKL
ncbi:MAG: phage portal protein [Halanaerobiales bacterium]